MNLARGNSVFLEHPWFWFRFSFTGEWLGQTSILWASPSFSEMQRRVCQEHGKCRTQGWERPAVARLCRNLYFMLRIRALYSESNGEPSKDNLRPGVGTDCLRYSLLRVFDFTSPHPSSNCLLCLDFPKLHCFNRFNNGFNQFVKFLERDEKKLWTPNPVNFLFGGPHG